MKHCLAFISVLFLGIGSPAGQTPEQDKQLFTVEQLAEDADFYFQKLFECQPSQYEYCSMVEFENMKDDIYARLTEPMGAEDFMWIIGRMNSLSSYHTGINLKFNPATIGVFENARDNGLELFPRVYIEGDKVSLKTGDKEKRLTTINGIPADSIMGFMRSYYNDKLSVNRNTYYMESFFALWLESYFKIKAPYKVSFDDGQEEVSVTGISADEFMDFSSFGIVRPPFVKHTVYPSSSTGIFTMSIFNIRRIPVEELEKQIAAFRDSVNKYDIEYLFLDLSKNTGGTSRLSYPLFDIIPHDTITDRYSTIQKEEDGNKRYRHEDMARLPARNLYKTDKQLFVLQGTNTISAANYLCRNIKLNKLGTLVGQPSGEPTSELSASSSYSMPNTKLNFIVANAMVDFSDYFPADEKDFHPDIYYDVDYKIDFEESDLIEIVNKWKASVSGAGL